MKTNNENVIYTCGKMKGKSYKDAMVWRKEAEQHYYNRFDYNVKFLHPPRYYNYDIQYHNSEREIKEFELAKISQSDVLLVNLEDINNSVGAHFEIAYADYINKNTDRYIYIIGFGDQEDVHPWILDAMMRVESCVCDAVDYIYTYILT